MGRTYAGILGPIAFGVTVARNTAGGENADATLIAAAIALFVFAAIGYVIGFIAERTVVEAIDARFHARLKASEGADPGTRRTTTPRSGAEKPA